MKTGTNFIESLLNAINAISGYGYLAMPFAFAAGGWLSLAAILTIAATCAYTAWLLKRCIENNSLIKTYPAIGELAFGSTGRILMTLLMNVELYFTVIGMLIIEGDNIERIFPSTKIHFAGLNIKGRQAFVVLVTLILLPTTWPRNLRVLSYLSLGSFLVSFFILSTVLWAGAVDGVGFHESGDVFIMSGMPTTLSLLVFSYGGHTIMPTIFSSMENPSKVTIEDILHYADICVYIQASPPELLALLNTPDPNTYLPSSNSPFKSRRRSLLQRTQAKSVQEVFLSIQTLEAQGIFYKTERGQSTSATNL
ncbi:hypothetical protein KFK09_023857 [Dendrobium nobile]|uniref:Amino acid transporter transmembrane domain-containing protein n=1 Tax=Dendrobium nobile TaxID=94219 RepID=A0A8T3ACD8_DENNO|nr:hypothetical protein KFK09_023857 [Dendrobium nobile]